MAPQQRIMEGCKILRRCRILQPFLRPQQSSQVFVSSSASGLRALRYNPAIQF